MEPFAGFNCRTFHPFLSKAVSYLDINFLNMVYILKLMERTSSFPCVNLCISHMFCIRIVLNKTFIVSQSGKSFVPATKLKNYQH